ncbi:adaptin N, partial [Helicosporidium sp. ATCC 50920]
MSGSKPDVIKMKRDCFQRLIRYMTQGIDMSAALVPATKCVALSRTDVPLKKMLYLYLRTSARRNGSVALLVVQTLLNDCKDVDATIRGAALRSMCSLRVPELEEAVLAAISAGLGDPHPYVREAAVLGVLKMWEQSPGGVRTHGFADAVRSLLGTDADPQVVANCLVVLEGLGALRGPISRALVVPLLNHIRAFSDWAQCQVLELVLRYEPDTAQERYDVLEVLDFALGSPNSAVFLAAARLFLRYTQGDAEQHRRVLSRLLDPLLTLVQSRQAEVVWAVLCNVLVLARRGKADGEGPTPAQLALSPLLPALRPRVEDP